MAYLVLFRNHIPISVGHPTHPYTQRAIGPLGRCIASGREKEGSVSQKHKTQQQQQQKTVCYQKHLTVPQIQVKCFAWRNRHSGVFHFHFGTFGNILLLDSPGECWNRRHIPSHRSTTSTGIRSVCEKAHHFYGNVTLTRSIW